MVQDGNVTGGFVASATEAGITFASKAFALQNLDGDATTDFLLSTPGETPQKSLAMFMTSGREGAAESLCGDESEQYAGFGLAKGVKAPRKKFISFKGGKEC